MDRYYRQDVEEKHPFLYWFTMGGTIVCALVFWLFIGAATNGAPDAILGIVLMLLYYVGMIVVSARTKNYKQFNDAPMGIKALGYVIAFIGFCLSFYFMIFIAAAVEGFRKRD